MNVKIKNISHAFDLSQIKHKWEKQNGLFTDHYIGGVHCFLKQINNDDCAFDFLRAIKAAEVVGIPTLYDIVDLGKISILFFQFKEGKTLFESLKDEEFRLFLSQKDSLGNILSDLYRGLTQIHHFGYWHNDFCTKNIQVIANNKCIILDLDSVIPLEDLVTSSNTVDHSLTGTFTNLFLQNNISIFNELKVDGKKFNMLQLASLMILLHFLKYNQHIRYNSQLASDFDVLVTYLKAKHSRVEELFGKGLNYVLTLDDLKEMLNHLDIKREHNKVVKILLSSPSSALKDVIDIGQKNKTNGKIIDKVAGLVIKINRFEIKPALVKYNQPVTISWDVTGADKVDIEGINTQLPAKGEKSVIITSPMIYTIKIGNISKVIKADIDKDSYPKPQLNYFKINGSKINVIHEIEKGRNVKVEWDFRNCTSVIINGIEYASNGSYSFLFEKKIKFDILAQYKTKDFVSSKSFSNIYEISEKALPPIEMPLFNKLELNLTPLPGSRDSVILLNKGDEYKLTWICSNCTTLKINKKNSKNIGFYYDKLDSKEHKIEIQAFNERGNDVKKTYPITITLRARNSPPPPPVEARLIQFVPGVLPGYVIEKNSNNRYEITFENLKKWDIFLQFSPGVKSFWFKIDDGEFQKFENIPTYLFPINETLIQQPHVKWYRGDRSLRTFTVRYTNEMGTTLETKLFVFLQSDVNQTFTKPLIKEFHGYQKKNIIILSWKTENVKNLELFMGGTFLQSMDKINNGYIEFDLPNLNEKHISRNQSHQFALKAIGENGKRIESEITVPIKLDEKSAEKHSKWGNKFLLLVLIIISTDLILLELGSAGTPLRELCFDCIIFLFNWPLVSYPIIIILIIFSLYKIFKK